MSLLTTIIKEDIVNNFNKYKTNKNVCYIYSREFSQSNIIGNCSNLYRLHNPISYQDFFDKYLSYSYENKNKLIKDRGLTIKELEITAKKICKRCQFSYKFWLDFYWLLVYHIIVETFDGHAKEIDFKNYLLSNGFNIKKQFDGSIDALYGIDIVGEKNGVIYYFQIKPLSFLKGNSDGLKYDRKNLIKKYFKFKELYNAETYYSFYYYNDVNELMWLNNNNNGFCFRLENVLNISNGDVILKYR